MFDEKYLKYMARKVREERDALLAQTDKYLLPDFPITEERKQKVIEYRQKLRDITKSKHFPMVRIPKLNLEEDNNAS